MINNIAWDTKHFDAKVVTKDDFMEYKTRASKWCKHIYATIAVNFQLFAYGMYSEDSDNPYQINVFKFINEYPLCDKLRELEKDPIYFHVFPEGEYHEWKEDIIYAILLEFIYTFFSKHFTFPDDVLDITRFQQTMEPPSSGDEDITIWERLLGECIESKQGKLSDELVLVLHRNQIFYWQDEGNDLKLKFK